MGYEEQYKQYVSDIETALQGALPLRKITERCIYESARYSLLAGGKRVRPVLLLEFATRFGCDKERAMPYALALEMIHTYSLIHDDLPCMDNDSMRRGRPTNHMVYGEAVALLAGDALLNRAYELMLNAAIKDGLNGVKAAAYISRSAGIAGMIGGQGIDLVSENQPVDAFVLTDMYLKKTCALIDAACVGGAYDDEPVQYGVPGVLHAGQEGAHTRARPRDLRPAAAGIPGPRGRGRHRAAAY